MAGGIGLAAGANIGDSYGMFEPVHGSAPKHAGKNRANLVATILTANMMLEWLGEYEAARRIENAVEKVLSEGKAKMYDLCGTATSDMGRDS
ncbi:MAG: isocitrate/isopropylmalate family dehydrogenase [Candidatus Bathyarchaeia archaeon]